MYRSWAIPCAGRDVYYTRNREQGLAKIREAGVRRRAERLYEQLDMLQHLRQQARRELLAESRKHAITAKLRQIPYLGPIRSALAVALIQTPHRFRTKRQLWAYSGLALETRINAEYRTLAGPLLGFRADSRQLQHLSFPPFNLHKARVRRTSGFLLTAFSNARPSPLFCSTQLTTGRASEKALA